MKRHITFCLCPQVPLFPIACAIEVLRHANRLADKPVYDWTFLCENDEPVQDSNGLWLHPSCPLAEARNPDIAFIVAGSNANDLIQPRLLQWLQVQARHRRIVGGITNGAFQLASVGLLNQHAATTHWEDFESFCVLYPQVLAKYQRFVIDRRRITCSGGSATLDLFIEIVRQDHGPETALAVSRLMLLQDYSLPRQTVDQLIFDGSHHYSARVQRALSLLDAGVGQSINVSELASRIGISRRELLRLFKKEIGKAPSEILNQRRLERAQSLVLHSQLSLAMVASTTGFSSQSHLTSNYRKQYGTTPAQHRRKHRMGP
jgi:transcriptional regulator GlxA family with amidase domain